MPADPWCVMSFDRDQHGVAVRERWCRLADQPRTRPDYADAMQTACDRVASFPCGIERCAPTCEDCNAG